AGALFPDIDTDSKGQTLFYILLLALDGLLLWQRRTAEAAWLGLAAMVPPLLQHRGFTHTLWCLLLCTGALFLAPQWLDLCSQAQAVPVAAAFGAGYASHLLMDHLF
ncbi:MAG: metal-dependent hydrolase, partial [Desulfovibrionaceae bacterium]